MCVFWCVNGDARLGGGPGAGGIGGGYSGASLTKEQIRTHVCIRVCCIFFFLFWGRSSRAARAGIFGACIYIYIYYMYVCVCVHHISFVGVFAHVHAWQIFVFWGVFNLPAAARALARVGFHSN